MPKWSFIFKNFIDNFYKQNEYSLESYKKIVEEINKINLSYLSDYELRELSLNLKKKAQSGTILDELLVETFALVCEACQRVLKIKPFDTQLIAGIALYKDKMVEMQTGEGKTLAAVAPAYLNALTGNGVHVLTFNDYLAKRDAEWMGSIYEFLGLTVSYIKEGMTIPQRQAAYSCDIVYLTAKEAGFDYLRDFLCTQKDNLIHRPFNYAIIDEADSILIDEARVPLVIAGEITENEKEISHFSKIVKDLKKEIDFNVELNGSNIYLTDEGLMKVEKIIGSGNLYSQNNLDILTRLNCALYAEYLLIRDKDYIVRNGKIEIVDEFTGRIADRRHWPDNIQAAVEAKEGISSKSKGTIMGSIALQHFLSLYPKISGMTGTARTSAEEFKEFYNLDVVIIPTNKPCIRNDYPDMIFTHKDAKYKALISEIVKVHKTGQPILIGTESVEESEKLAHYLIKSDIKCEVLNAKNDELEAKIIARAGELGAVTVSTNMAGRGVDIKLGGVDEKDREKVVSLGGLYVIGTNHFESRRIDNQLRGRTGRQGDPGQSRFSVSLEDDFIIKYEIDKLIPKKSYPKKQSNPIQDKVVVREIARGQRIVEGYNLDVRRQLLQYSYILEQQRRIIHNRRMEILLDKAYLSLLVTKAEEKYKMLCNQFGTEVLKKVEKQLTLFYINKCWADYLDHIAYIREGIHLVVIGNKNPVYEFYKASIEAFDEMLEQIDTEIIKKFQEIEISENGIDINKEGLTGPSSTWTYLINEDTNQFSRLPYLMKTMSTFVSGTVFSLQDILKKFLRKIK